MYAAEVSRFTILESQPLLRHQASQSSKSQTFQCDTCHLLYSAAVARQIEYVCGFDCLGQLLPLEPAQ